MRNDWLITFRSITFAQRGERLLGRMGITTVLQRTPKALAERGCSYSLRVRENDGADAVEILRKYQLPFLKIYILENGDAQEQIL